MMEKDKDVRHKTNINWYPGHMLKTKKQITEDLKLIDVVIEILDARIPKSSQNPDIQKIIMNKKRIILLNKSDLANDSITKQWIEYFRNNGMNAIKTDSNLGQGTNECLKLVEKITEEEMQKAREKGRIKKNIRIMIIGIPNVGKSSFINRIVKRKTAEVGNRPGVTKQKQWVRISNNIELLDTPGVLWPKFEDKEVALNLSFTGTIKDEVIEKAEVAYELLKKMLEINKNNIMQRYKLTDEEMSSIINNSENDQTLQILDIIAKKRGAIISKGEVDYEKISAIILTDFRTGKLGKITLEKPNEN